MDRVEKILSTAPAFLTEDDCTTIRFNSHVRKNYWVRWEWLMDAWKWKCISEFPTFKQELNTKPYWIDRSPIRKSARQ
jgi:hypothetical protein